MKLGNLTGRLDPKTGDMWTTIGGKNVLVPVPKAEVAPATNPRGIVPRVIPPKSSGKKKLTLAERREKLERKEARRQAKLRAQGEAQRTRKRRREIRQRDAAFDRLMDVVD